MSLINDALKKAQRQRGDSTPPAPAAPATPPMPGPISATPSRRAAQGPRPQLYLLGAGALLGLGLALGAVFLFRDATPPTATPAETATASATTSPTPGDVARPPASPASGPLTAPAANPTAAPAGEAALITVSTRPAAPPTATPEPGASEPARAATGPAPKPSLRMINTIEAFRIAGVRASGTDSKVLMNDRVYRVGDTVDHELAIRITAVTANSLTFVDDSGATYTRNF